MEYLTVDDGIPGLAVSGSDDEDYSLSIVEKLTTIKNLVKIKMYSNEDEPVFFDSENEALAFMKGHFPGVLFVKILYFYNSNCNFWSYI